MLGGLAWVLTNRFQFNPHTEQAMPARNASHGKRSVPLLKKEGLGEILLD